MPCHWRAILTKPCLQGLIDDLLEGFKKLQALGGVSATNGLNTASEERLNGHDIPSNHFLGMKIATAAITLLDQSKQPLSTRVMAEALERGGSRGVRTHKGRGTSSYLILVFGMFLVALGLLFLFGAFSALVREFRISSSWIR
jgi:hypothetical protein